MDSDYAQWMRRRILESLGLASLVWLASRSGQTPAQAEGTGMPERSSQDLEAPLHDIPRSTGGQAFARGALEPGCLKVGDAGQTRLAAAETDEPVPLVTSTTCTPAAALVAVEPVAPFRAKPTSPWPLHVDSQEWEVRTRWLRKLEAETERDVTTYADCVRGGELPARCRRVDWLIDGRWLVEAARVRTPNRVRDNAWAAAAQAEADSTPSFLRARHELRRLGAPAELCDRYLEAAEQEARHAELVGRAASQFDERRWLADPVPPLRERRSGWASVAVYTIEEAIRHETAAALEAEWMSKVCDVPWLRDLWTAIARDEASHAVLGWHTLCWTLEQGGPDVVRAVRRALDVRHGAPSLHGWPTSNCQRDGRPSASARAAVFAWTQTRVVDPLLGALSSEVHV